MLKTRLRFLSGTLEEDDMMSGVRMAKLTDLGERNCLKVAEFEEFGEQFDFDLQVKTRVKKTVAKLVRFFEVATDSKAVLEDHFGPSDEPTDPAGMQKLAHFLRKEKASYKVQTPSGEIRVRHEGGTNEAGKPQGPGVLTVLSDFRRRDLFRGTDNETEAETADEANYRSKDDMEAFLDEYLPLEMMPPKLSERKRVKTLAGKFENGVLTGYVRLTHLDGSVLEGFCVDGALHGVRELLIPDKYGATMDVSMFWPFCN